MTDHRIPPRIDGEPVDCWLWLGTWLRMRTWAEPYEAVAYAHHVPPAAVATAASRWRWEARVTAADVAPVEPEPAPVPSDVVTLSVGAPDVAPVA
ncbi:hypothetical protein ACWC0C_29640 [Streptomyces sp. NPDC001709]